jgi:hypothetical protein
MLNFGRKFIGITMYFAELPRKPLSARFTRDETSMPLSSNVMIRARYPSSFSTAKQSGMTHRPLSTRHGS